MMKGYDYYTTRYQPGFTNDWHRSLRRCPVCHVEMHTNNHGYFRCMKCGYSDYRAVEKYRAAGLDYEVPAHIRNNSRILFGSRAIE